MFVKHGGNKMDFTYQKIKNFIEIACGLGRGTFLIQAEKTVLFEDILCCGRFGDTLEIEGVYQKEYITLYFDLKEIQQMKISSLDICFTYKNQKYIIEKC